MTPFTRLFLNFKVEQPNACHLFLYEEHFYAFGQDALNIAPLIKKDVHYNEDFPEPIQASVCFPIQDLSHYFQLFTIELYKLVIKNPVLGTNPQDRELYDALCASINRRNHCRLQVKTA